MRQLQPVKAHWLLYLPPDLTFKTPQFVHSVTSFVSFSESALISSPNSIKRHVVLIGKCPS